MSANDLRSLDNQIDVIRNNTRSRSWRLIAVVTVAAFSFAGGFAAGRKIATSHEMLSTRPTVFQVAGACSRTAGVAKEEEFISLTFSFVSKEKATTEQDVALGLAWKAQSGEQWTFASAESNPRDVSVAGSHLAEVIGVKWDMQMKRAGFQTLEGPLPILFGRRTGSGQLALVASSALTSPTLEVVVAFFDVDGSQIERAVAPDCRT